MPEGSPGWESGVGAGAVVRGGMDAGWSGVEVCREAGDAVRLVFAAWMGLGNTSGLMGGPAKNGRLQARAARASSAGSSSSRKSRLNFAAVAV